MEKQLLCSLICLILLTLFVWLKMYYVRFGEIKRAQLSLEELRTDNLRNLPVKFVTSGDNFRNLLELPILFYLLGILLLYTNQVDHLYVVLSWVFVISRFVHSFIHTGYNNVKHRFLVYVSGALVLWFMWFRFAWKIFI